MCLCIISFIFFWVNSLYGNQVNLIVNSYPRITNNTGNAIFILKNEQNYNYVFGSKSKSFYDPIKDTTQFEIGSISKIFTTLILLDSINKQIISNINDSIVDYLPPNVSKFENSITFKHIITHTSMLPRDLFNTSKLTNEQLESFMNNYKSTKIPGIEYQYSNLAFVVLSYILQHQLNKTYDEMILDTITSELKMKNTKCLIPSNDIAIGYNSNIEQPYFNGTSISCGCGGILSTINDMKLFLFANLNDNNTYISKLLKQSHNLLYHNDLISIAYTWHIKKLANNKQIISHAGDTRGFSSYIGFNKEEKLGVVALTNEIYSHERLGVFLIEHLI